MENPAIHQFVPLKRVGTSITPKIAGDALDATIIGSTTPAAGSFSQISPTINVETLAAARTLLVTDYICQWLDPNGVTRDVIFPAEASSTNLMFILLNDGSQATFDLVCKNDAAVTIATLGPGMSGIFSCDGTNWKWEDETGVYYDAVSGNVEIAGLLSQIGLGASTYLGFEAGKVDDLSNNNNTGIGYQTLRNVTTGIHNMAVGYQACLINTTGTHNVAVGSTSLRSNTTGVQNTAIGDSAIYSNAIGSQNVGIGASALTFNTDGIQNIAIGSFAGRYELGSDAFYVNNQDRTNTANEKLTSIIYGIMAAAVADQKLTFNAHVKIDGAQSVSKIDAGAADYNPSILTSDYIITVDTTAAARNVIISTEDRDTGSTTSPRIFIIKDIVGNANANNITVSLETAGNIDGAANVAINVNYDSITIMVDGTNGFVI